MNSTKPNILEPPRISNDFKIINLERFFYEYALFKNIDITPYEITQAELNKKLNMVNRDYFKEEILDTMIISNSKNFLVELKRYNLKNEIKVSEEIFDLFKRKQSLSGKITLEFDKVRNLFYISEFEEWSFKYSLDDYLKSNLNYIDLLHSFNFNSHNLLFREKISIIARLLPYVQKNINIIEITKPQVGKSYISDELLTKHSIVKKVGDLTEANLFQDLKSKDSDDAILKNTSVLCIDEFHKGDFSKIASGLQTFMENGKVSRGSNQYYSDTSIVMYANFKKANISKKMYINPEEFNPFKDIPGIDDAFLQRINYLNPSFGMRTLNDDMFLNNQVQRIPTSLYSDLFEELREIDIDIKKVFPNIKVYADGKSADMRIISSIFKVTSGFIKLLFPDVVDILRNIKDYSSFNSSTVISKFSCCFYLAMEGIAGLSAFNNRKFDHLQIVIDNQNIITLGDAILYRNIISYFLWMNPNSIIAIYPHRYVIIENYQISQILNNQVQYQNYSSQQPMINKTNYTKLPLDTFGIEENQYEAQVYQKLKLPNNYLNYAMLTN